MIANNQVTDLTPIPNFKRLDFFELYDNHISDISPLANMSTVLTLLRLESNQISDLSPLGRWAGSSKLDHRLHEASREHRRPDRRRQGLQTDCR